MVELQDMEKPCMEVVDLLPEAVRNHIQLKENIT